MNSQRCQPPAVLRKLNAAPVLYASTRSSVGISSTDEARSSHATAASFVD